MSTTVSEKNTVFVVLQLIEGEGGEGSTWKQIGTPVAAKSKKAAVERFCASDPDLVGQKFNVVPLSSWLTGDDLIHPQLKLAF